MSVNLLDDLLTVRELPPTPPSTPPSFNDWEFFTNREGDTWRSKAGNWCTVRLGAFIVVRRFTGTAKHLQGYYYSHAKYGDRAWSGAGWERWQTEDEAIDAALIRLGLKPVPRPTPPPFISSPVMLDLDEEEAGEELLRQLRTVP
jgi:hypothetical protein